MALKIKHRNPKITDFKTKDIVINVNEGTLFYKTKNKLFKIQGGDLSTTATEFSGLGEDLILKGNLIPDGSGSYDLGSSTNPWKDLHVLDESIKFYDSTGEVGRLQYERGKGLKVKDNTGADTSLSASIVIAKYSVKSQQGSFTGVTGSIDCGLF